MLINNEFVFLPIPRNASTSIYKSLNVWNIPIDFGPERANIELKNNSQNKHYHFSYSELINFFPNKPFIAIYREPTDRFISAIYYFFDNIFNEKSLQLKYNFLKFNTEDFIYFFKDFMIELNNYTKEKKIISVNPFFNKYFINSEFDINQHIKLKSFMGVFLSQYYYGIEHCDEIIPMENIKILEQKIQIIKPNFNFIKINEKNLKLNLNIKKTEKLQEFVYEFIDKPFFNIQKTEKTFI
jgi:hypothetical protein